MKLTCRKLIRSLSAVLAAFAVPGRKSPTVGLAALEMKPRSLGVTTLISMREYWGVDKDGKWWLMQQIGDTRCFRAVPPYWHGEPPFHTVYLDKLWPWEKKA